MRQLQEQADELRRVIRQWAGHSEARSDHQVDRCKTVTCHASSFE
jgi:hypothetical protein